MGLLGYARVSTPDKTTDPQTDQLTAAGCTRIFAETVSGAKRDRPQLDALLDYARPGDTIVTVKLDRLGRSLHHLLDVVADLGRRGIEFRSLSDGIDTSTSTGKLVFHILASIAEFELDLIRERTSAGLAAARARGRVGGRPVTLTPARLHAARALVEAGHSITDAAEAVGVGRSTLYRALGEAVEA